MFTLQAKPICMRLMPAFSGWLCALGGEYITNGHWRKRSLFSLCLWILPFLYLRMLNSPLFKIKYVLLGSASEPVNFLFLSAKWNFLDNGIVFTDNVSSHPFLWRLAFIHMVWVLHTSHFILYYFPSLSDGQSHWPSCSWIHQSCSCFCIFSFAPFQPKMFYS